MYLKNNQATTDNTVASRFHKTKFSDVLQFIWISANAKKSPTNKKTLLVTSQQYQSIKQRTISDNRNSAYPVVRRKRTAIRCLGAKTPNVEVSIT